MAAPVLSQLGGGIPKDEVGNQTRAYTEYFGGGHENATNQRTRTANYADVVNKRVAALAPLRAGRSAGLLRRRPAPPHACRQVLRPGDQLLRVWLVRFGRAGWSVSLSAHLASQGHVLPLRAPLQERDTEGVPAAARALPGVEAAAGQGPQGAGALTARCPNRAAPERKPRRCWMLAAAWAGRCAASPSFRAPM